MAGYDSTDSGVYDTVDTAFLFKYTGQPGKDVSEEGPSKGGGPQKPPATVFRLEWESYRSELPISPIVTDTSGPRYVPRGVIFELQSARSSSVRDQAAPGVSLDGPEYRMDNQQRGLALIFNQENFNFPKEPGLNDRTGTEIDRDALMRAFGRLGFEVRNFNDLDYDEICQELRRAAAEDHTYRDCIAVAVLSHGGQNGMLYARDRVYHISALMEPFTPERCATLTGKPKLFFIQASRSERLEGLEVSDFDFGSPGASYADVLISYSTYEGFNSFRNVVNGSWYVQTLCAQLNSQGRSTDLMSLLTNVNRIVGEQFVSVNPLQPWLHNRVQQPCFTSSLRRSLWFR